MPGPNIMLLYVDQMRADAMRCAGNLAIKTPNLDRLAAQGVRFTNAITTTPVCIAARYALLTGRRSGHNGRYGNNNVDPEPCLDTLPALLGHADYLNYSVGKMHFLPKRRHYGFHFRRVMSEIPDWRQDDDYLLFLKERGYGHKREVHGVRNLLYVQPQTSPLPEELHGSTWVGDEIIDFLRLNHNRKFFLWAGWIGPHPPYNAPEPFASMYRLEDMPAPIAPDFDPDDLPLVMQMQRYYANYENASSERLLRCVALYYAVTSLIDKQVGRILDTLDELGIADDTLLVFTGDHGELLGDYGCVQKSNPRDQAVRIPMIARWPGRLPQGATCDQLVTCTDLLPTLPGRGRTASRRRAWRATTSATTASRSLFCAGTTSSPSGSTTCPRMSRESWSRPGRALRRPSRARTRSVWTSWTWRGSRTTAARWKGASTRGCWTICDTGRRPPPHAPRGSLAYLWGLGELLSSLCRQFSITRPMFSKCPTSSVTTVASRFSA